MKLMERPKVDTWEVPANLFVGDVLILGNGPSLKHHWINACPWMNTIAINDAYLRAPRADVLYFADEGWYKSHKEHLDVYEGPLAVTRSRFDRDNSCRLGSKLRVVDRSWGCGISRSPSHLAGFDSGSNAINLAYLGGAKRVLLLGFDMRPGHWHSRRYEDDCPDTHYADWFMPSHRAMAEALQDTDCEVINITPDSALTCYPTQRPEAFGITRMDR